MSDLRRAAEWLVNAGYPIDFYFGGAPAPLWEEVVNVIHEDADGTFHGNELTREEVASWLIDP